MNNTRTKQTIGRIAYGVREVAESLGVSPGFVRLEIARGKLKTFRAGRRVLITKASFEGYVEAVA